MFCTAAEIRKLQVQEIQVILEISEEEYVFHFWVETRV